MKQGLTYQLTERKGAADGHSDGHSAAVPLSGAFNYIDILEFVNFTVQEIAAMLLLNPYSDKNIPSESAHRIVGIRAVVKSEHGIIAPFTEQRSALAADIIRRSDPA